MGDKDQISIIQLWSLVSHLDAFALVVAADCDLGWGGGSSRRGHSVAFRFLGPLSGDQGQGESGEEGRSLTQKAADGLLLLHGPLRRVPVGLCFRTSSTNAPH